MIVLEDADPGAGNRNSKWLAVIHDDRISTRKRRAENIDLRGAT